MKNSHYILLSLLLGIFVDISCTKIDNPDPKEEATLVKEKAAYPAVYYNEGIYYMLTQSPPPNTISIHLSNALDSLDKSDQIILWDGNEKGMYNIWSPEIIRINDRWLIYFEADDGNTDDHQLYVIENPNSDPLTGKWELHGPIITNDEWNFGIHPSALELNGKQYLVWSGWEHRRAETETQCIFLAEMENPWTLKSERILISRPEYEWERQWINPDGSRSAYPIFVNENPEIFLSPDKKNVFVAYSASGIWTPYATIGLLKADSESVLTDPSSWNKIDHPLSTINPDAQKMFAISNISVANNPDNQTSYIFFQARNKENGETRADIYFKELNWDSDSMPLFGF